MRPKSVLIANILPVYSLSTKKIDTIKPPILGWEGTKCLAYAELK